MTLPTIGFVGLGTMGRPMALNIRRRGYAMVVHDKMPAGVEALVAAGATQAASPAEVARACEVAITILPEPADVLAVALGPGGLIEGFCEGAAHIEMSTIDPATSRRVGARLAERGVRMLDCPVGRLQEHAARGELVLMAGGPEDLLAEVRPILECMGTDIFHCGPLGNGHAVKLVNNGLATTILAATCEALVNGHKAGLPLDVMQRVMAATMARNGQLEVSLPAKALIDDLTAGFMIRLARKDVRLATELARAQGVPTPVTDQTLLALGRCVDAGWGELDVTALLKSIEQPAGITVRKARS